MVIKIYILAQTLHQEADVRVGHVGSRHVHNASVWLAVQCILRLCGEQIIASGFRCVKFRVRGNSEAVSVVACVCVCVISQ